MTLDRIAEIRRIAAAHPGRQSTAIILELVGEIERMTELYCLALDYGWSHHRSRNTALSKLKELATQ